MESVLTMSKTYFADDSAADNAALKELAEASELRSTLPEWFTPTTISGEVLRVADCDALHTWVVEHCLYGCDNYSSRDVYMSYSTLKRLRDAIDAAVIAISKASVQWPEAVVFVGSSDYVEQLKGILKVLDTISEIPQAWKFGFSYRAIWPE